MIRLQRSLITPLQGPNVQASNVIDSLQQAIELEHSTIPLYLYALYSLDEAKNAEIAQILQSVVIEEMLHMTLASNVLNALGGSPVIDKPGFIPTYPGPLPGGVEADLKVNLAPFSPAQLETFIKIEEPEHPLEFPSALALIPTITIGEFYTAISKAIGNLGEGAFVKPPRNQVGPDLMWESIVVTDIASAQQAIQTIIDQGEGTKETPEEGVGHGYAHYYRYMQIKKGHLLVPVPGETQPDKKYAYTGAPITLDPSGVYAVPTNPGLPPGYPPGSAQAFANDNFNYTYTTLLRAIHDLVNGEANRAQMNRAIGLMMSLKEQAKAMMSGIPNPKVLTGPSFQYQPTNPPPPAVA
jgi:bacterioferritin (cytochrome b1)